MASPSGDTTGATDRAAIQSEINALGGGGGTVTLASGTFYVNATIAVPSNVIVNGAGAGSTTVIAKISAYSNPRFYQKLAAFTMAGACADDDFVAIYAAPGDCFTSSARAFALGLAIPAGATSFQAASTALVADLAPGEWVHLSEGLPAWHPAKSEFVQVASVSGVTVNLSTPTRNSYSNRPYSLGDFVRKFALTTSPGNGAPGFPNMATWIDAGFRKVAPVRNASIRNMTIICQQTNPVLPIPWFMWGTVGCSVLDVQFDGYFWHLDSQDITVRASGGTAGLTSFIGNGCNGVSVNLTLTQAFAVEEGAQSVSGTIQAVGYSTIQMFSKDIDLTLVANNASGSPVLQFMRSRNVRIRPTLTSTSTGVYLVTPSVAALTGDARYLTPEVLAYYDNGHLHAVGGSVVSSGSPASSVVSTGPSRMILFGTSVPVQVPANGVLPLVYH